MAVLVTRPTIYATDIYPNCVYLPLIKNVAHQTETYLQAIQSVNSYHIIIFVSSFAVHTVMPNLIKLSYSKNIKFFAIGKATATTLKKYQINATYPIANSCSESLLALPELQNVSHKRVIIFCSHQGRTKIQDILRQRKAWVNSVPVYTTTNISYNLEELQQKLDGYNISYLTATSYKILISLKKIIEKYNKSWHDLPLVVPSQRLYDIAKSSSFHTVILSSSASIEDILLSIDN